MVPIWSSLGATWQRAMCIALETYLQGSAPIGALVVDGSERPVSRGANRFLGDRLAHAEMEALRGIPPDVERKALALYTTLEPCPMCTGALRMMQLRAVHYAARDPAAGSTGLLTANEFMRRFPCEPIGPDAPALEFVAVAALLEYRTRNGHDRWRESWHAYQPEAVELGEALAASGRFHEWQRAHATAEEIFCEVAARAG